MLGSFSSTPPRRSSRTTNQKVTGAKRRISDVFGSDSDFDVSQDSQSEASEVVVPKEQRNKIDSEDDESDESEFVESSESSEDEEDVDELEDDVPIPSAPQVPIHPPRAARPQPRHRQRAPNQFERMLGGGAQEVIEPDAPLPEDEAVEANDDEAVEEDDFDQVRPAPAAPVRRRAAPTRKTPEQLRTAQNERLWVHHPELRTVWDELAALPTIEIPEDCPQPQNVLIKLLPFQLEGVHWLLKQEQSRFNRGILADEMGMGKTIEIISLIVSSSGTKPNLILTPTVAILPWLSEFNERVPPNLLKICVFNGTNLETSAKKLEEFDVVLTTFAISESLYRKQQSGFKRVGEMDKEKVFKESFKWSVTGTPLQNRVGELYSLIRFLDADPFSYYFCRQCPCKIHSWAFSNRRHCNHCGHISHSHFCWWNAEILKPIQNYGGTGEGLVAFNKLGILLDRIMLRRTKLERADDLGLPPRVVVVRRDVVNQAEEELYNSLYDNSKRQFSTYVASNTVLNNYASIFSWLSRMRLA
ncbi:DNA repair protein rad16, partial [Podochytrium sp. JEL0797]